MQLRKLQLKDAEYMLEWMHDESVVRHLSANFAAKKLDDCKKFIESSLESDSDLSLAIVDKDDIYMGTVSLKHIDKEQGIAEFAITIRKSAMGKGYSSYGMKEIIRIGLEELNLKKIVWCVSKDNERAIRFYDKNQYKRTTNIPFKSKEYYTEEQLRTFIWYMVEKKVSIIVPVYNAEKSIRECVSRIQRQTYSTIEIICVNDGSKDGSQKILEELAEKDSRIVVVQKENGGVSSARNMGLDMATGQYVEFVDSDDLIDEDMVELLVRALEESDAQMAICGYCFSNGQESRVPEAETLEKEEFLKKFYSFYVGGFICSPWNKLFVRKCIKSRFDESMNLGEDAVFNIDYISIISRICMVNATPYLYEVGNVNSLSWRYNEKALYCEEKKNKRILQCLKEGNILEYQGAMKEEFAKDFKRCVDGEILSRKYSRKELIERVYAHVMHPFWYEILLETELLEETSALCLKRKIKTYVTKMLVMGYGFVLGKKLKMILKGCR